MWHLLSFRKGSETTGGGEKTIKRMLEITRYREDKTENPIYHCQLILVLLLNASYLIRCFEDLRGLREFLKNTTKEGQSLRRAAASVQGRRKSAKTFHAWRR